MDLLIAHGATIDGPDGGSAVNGCLHNGRGEAAEYLANRGARLDLEAAAGVGRLDVVQELLQRRRQSQAAGYARSSGPMDLPGLASSAEPASSIFCYEQGSTSMRSSRMTDRPDCIGPRTAATRTPSGCCSTTAQRSTVETTASTERPLGWALYGWSSGPRPAGRGSYYEAVGLTGSGRRKTGSRWYEDDEDRRHARDKVQSDPRMAAALRGEF